MNLRLKLADVYFVLVLAPLGVPGWVLNSMKNVVRNSSVVLTVHSKSNIQPLFKISGLWQKRRKYP